MGIEERKPYLIDGDNDGWYLSLNKLTGQKVKDIYGYIDTEGDPVFLMTRLILEDGTDFSVEGEHDRPYLYSGWYKNGAKYVVDLETLSDDDEGGD